MSASHRFDGGLYFGPAQKDGSGYFAFETSKESKLKTLKVHKEVLNSFIGRSDLQAAHLNGNKEDNRLCNLAYVTAKENAAHKKNHGTYYTGEKVGTSKLLNSDVSFIRLHSTKDAHYLAEKFEVSEKHIKEIISYRKRKNG